MIAAATTSFAAAKQTSELHFDRLEAVWLVLIALAQHPRQQGSGVSVTRFWKQGSVSYAKIPALKGVDLSACRGKTREEVRVTTG